MNNEKEFDFKGYLKNNPLLKETDNNINESQLRERVRAEILSTLKENTMLMREPSVKAKVEEVIEILNSIDVDGETMEYILKQVGMEDQMQHQLTPGGIEEAEETETEEETSTEVADVEPQITGDEKEIQDALTQAYEAASKIGDQKLLDQIGNTITFFTRTHIVSNK